MTVPVSSAFLLWRSCQEAARRMNPPRRAATTSSGAPSTRKNRASSYS